MLRKSLKIPLAPYAVPIALILLCLTATVEARNGQQPPTFDQEIADNGRQLFEDGKRIFRFETFDDQVFWGNTLKLHLAIIGDRLGGVGPGVSPDTALALGLKVDSEALPEDVTKRLRNGEINLDDPANTVELLRLNAVVGLTGFFDRTGRLASVGIQCALCHSTVDDSLAPGVGKRLDGWANRDLDIGAIIATAPDLSFFASILDISQDEVRSVLNSWGPGKFDAHLILDGKAFNDGMPAASLIPPAFGLAGVNAHGWLGFGSIPYWNALVANLEMQGSGVFFDPRLRNSDQFPIAAEQGFDNVRNIPDLITPKLPALHFYQLAIPAPKPPKGSFDKDAAARGKTLFGGKARCAQCHVPPLFTEPGYNLHTPSEIGIDSFQANRGPERRYRTAPLKGLWSHQKGGFYHDGRFATLEEVVEHYNTFFDLELTGGQKSDLIEYLKSL